MTAITNNTAAGTYNSSTQSSTSQSLTISSGTNIVLIACCMQFRNSNTPDSPSTFTFGGNAMTLYNHYTRVSGSTNLKHSWYYMINPPTGTNSVSFSWTNATISGCFGAVFNNVHQTTPISTFYDLQGTLSNTATTVSGDMVLDAINVQSGATINLTVTGGQTQIFNAGASTARGGSSYEAASGTSVGTSWSIDNGVPFYTVAVLQQAPEVVGSSFFALF